MKLKFQSDYINYLTLHGADKLKHAPGRSLLKHLVGTSELLQKWNNNDEICRAGLFHSIYGTFTFNKELISHKSRDDVQKLIGNKAEELVYYFCCFDKKEFYSLMEDHKSHYILYDYFANKKISISKVIYRFIMEISCANNIDHIENSSNISADHLLKSVHLWTKAKYWLSIPCYLYFLELFDLMQPSTVVRINQKRLKMRKYND